jgi:UDP-N-acetylglucosamine--N-acetylmuramyl-(pentapeptide) pyrophosphoryl-undecaprenol N-acetylglucosamine transferase
MPRSAYGWFQFLTRLFSSFKLCLNIVSDFKPDIVIGMGGYLSVPTILAASIKRRPRLIHESNVILGLSNQLCRFLGAKLLRGLPGTGGELIGTPIRQVLWEPRNLTESKKTLGFDPQWPVLLVFGGSQGARGINLQIPAILKDLSTRYPHRLQVIHISGQDSKAIEENYGNQPLAAKVFSYFEKMEELYGAADLVLCRAGGSTLSELCALKKPAILVPYPNATHDHQTENARVLEKAGSAVIVSENEIQQKVPALLEKLLLGENSQEKLSLMEDGYQRLNMPHPSQTIQKLTLTIKNLS